MRLPHHHRFTHHLIQKFGLKTSLFYNKHADDYFYFRGLKVKECWMHVYPAFGMSCVTFLKLLSSSSKAQWMLMWWSSSRKNLDLQMKRQKQILSDFTPRYAYVEHREMNFVKKINLLSFHLPTGHGACHELLLQPQPFWVSWQVWPLLFERLPSS